MIIPGGIGGYSTSRHRWQREPQHQQHSGFQHQRRQPEPAGHRRRPFGKGEGHDRPLAGLSQRSLRACHLRPQPVAQPGRVQCPGPGGNGLCAIAGQHRPGDCAGRCVHPQLGRGGFRKLESRRQLEYGSCPQRAWDFGCFPCGDDCSGEHQSGCPDYRRHAEPGQFGQPEHGLRPFGRQARWA